MASGFEFNASLNPSPTRSLLQPFLESSCNSPCYVAAQKTAAKDVIIAGVFFGRAKAAFYVRNAVVVIFDVIYRGRLGKTEISTLRR